MKVLEVGQQVNKLGSMMGPAFLDLKLLGWKELGLVVGT